MDHVDVGGLRIAYRRTGSGEPLVLLHGGLLDSREWRFHLEALSRDFTVVAWDAPGCGGSDDPPEHWTLGDVADALAGLIEALDLGRPHVAGLSFGGGLAIQLYGRHPQVPRSLVLASAYAGWAGSLPQDEVRRRFEAAVGEMVQDAEDVVNAILPTLFASRVADDIVEDAATMIREHHPAGSRVLLRAFAEADLRHVLPTIAVPTLVLSGELDERAPVETVARQLHGSIPGAEMVVLPGVGHMIDLEAPERFNAEVRSFVRRVDSRP